MKAKNKTPKLVDVLFYTVAKLNIKGGISETKLMKILYFIDANYYESHGQTLTGVKYYKNKFGPTPDFKEYLEAIKFLKDYLDRKQEQMTDYSRTTVRLVKKSYSPRLNPDQRKVIDLVVKDYGGLSRQEIVDASHMEPTYLGSRDLNDKIEFELVHHRQKDISDEEKPDNVETIDLGAEMNPDQLKRAEKRLSC